MILNVEETRWTNKKVLMDFSKEGRRGIYYNNNNDKKR